MTPHYTNREFSPLKGFPFTSTNPQRFRAPISAASASETPSDRNRMVLEFTEYFFNHYLSGRHLFFATTTYKVSEGFTLSPRAASRNLSAFYVALLQQVIHPHYWNRRRNWSHQPEVHAFLDVPASKRKDKLSIAKSPRDASDDYHHHMIVVAAEFASKGLTDLCHSAESREELIGRRPEAHVKTFDIQRIVPDFNSIAKCVDYASDYAQKLRRSSRTYENSYEVFPISNSERISRLPSKPTFILGSDKRAFICDTNEAPRQNLDITL